MAYHPFRHLGLKALAVSMAVLMWLSVSRDSHVERSVRAPLEFQNIPQGLELVNDTPATVDVRVRGTSSVLSRLEAGDVVAVIDLRAARPGQRMFHLLTDEVRAPFGVQIAQVNPPTVSLAVERGSSKVVPVVPAVEGEPAPGYVLGEVSCVPASVEVVGPESRLEALREAITEPVSIRNATRPVVDRVTVGVPDGMLRLKEARVATVTANVHPTPIERTLPGVRIRIRNLVPARGARFEPDTVSVVVSGAREDVGRLAPTDVTLFVDLASLGPGRYVLPVKADPAPRVRVLRTEPGAVKVRIR